MNRRLLLVLGTAALLVTGWTVAFTCEDKAAGKTAKTASNEKGACGAHTTTAVTASSAKSGCSAPTTTTAVTATNTSEGHRCSRKVSTETASLDPCAGKSTATTASKMACKTGAGMAGANGLFDATVAGGPGCSHDGSATTAHNAMGCDACADMAQSDSEILAAGGQTQVVRLKNGVMFIHTATGAAHVRAIQAALQRRTDRLRALAAMGDRAKLCPECKTMRGAMASGKLTREMVPIEGGCLTLMTSNDRSVIARLHAMAGEELARNKS